MANFECFIWTEIDNNYGGFITYVDTNFALHVCNIYRCNQTLSRFIALKYSPLS